MVINVRAEKFAKGLSEFYDRLRYILVDGEWSYFGIFSYDYIFFSDGLVICPENVCLAIAKLLSERDCNALILLNVEREGEFSLQDKEVLSLFQRTCEKEKRIKVSYFGIKEDVPWNRVKVSFGSFGGSADVVSRILSALSKKYDKIPPRKIKKRDIPSLGRTLSSILGPPSLGRYLILRAKKFVEGRWCDKICIKPSEFNQTCRSVFD